MNKITTSEDLYRFLTNLENPTYLRNEVRDYCKKGEFDMAFSVIRDCEKKSTCCGAPLVGGIQCENCGSGEREEIADDHIALEVMEMETEEAKENERIYGEL